MSNLNLKSNFIINLSTESSFLAAFFVLVTIIAFLLVFLSYILAEQKQDAEKISTYECGFESFDDSRQKFDIRFYLVAILFILFDLEIIFIMPWALALDGYESYASMVLFLALLVIGLIYEIGRGALNWN